MKEEVRSYLSRSLRDAVTEAFPEIGLTPAQVVVEKPKNPSFGDISSPLPVSLARALKRPPAEIARRLMDSFRWDRSFIEPDPELGRTVRGGFLNFRLSREYLNDLLGRLVTAPEDFGRNQVRVPHSILLEFVSANPTGPMVVVNARAAAVGDVTARLHEWIGNSVKREYYVNDYGRQVKLLGASLAARYLQSKGKGATVPEGGYEGEYVTELTQRIVRECPEVEALEEHDLGEFFQTRALEYNLIDQRRILNAFGVEYDTWFRESILHREGQTDAVMDILGKKGLVYEADGARWFRSSGFGDEKDRVMVRGDGEPTYFLADIAYHVAKAERGFDESYTFWGPDHHGYLPRLEAAVEALELRKPVFKNFIIQQVNLIRDGRPYLMSKRRGEIVTMSDLIDQVGVDAARYFFLMRRLSSHFDFDMDLAVRRSEDNPVYYVQYAHARTCNVLLHAAARGYSPEAIAGAQPDALDQPEELEILKIAAEFPHVVRLAAETVEPRKLTSYAETVAAAFHQFYQKHRIVTDDSPRTKARLLLTTGVKNLLRMTLGLLGVTAPERM